MNHLATTFGRFRSSFDLWLRRGVRVPEQLADPELELKYNHNHDPTNGQFTFGDGGGSADMARRPKRPEPSKGDGSWGGGGFTGGGGGSYGGAGSTGVYDLPRSRPKDHHRSVQARAPKSNAAVPVTVHPGSVKPSTRIDKNGYAFHLDTDHRTNQVNGNLSLAATPTRSKPNQRTAGGADRRRTDDGGHFIAARFNGPTDKFNHFAQDASFNRGEYRAVEDRWAKDLPARKPVHVDIVAHYPGASKRPDRLRVRWFAGGRWQHQDFHNESRGTSRGR